jgi:hypothetical protein
MLQRDSFTDAVCFRKIAQILQENGLTKAPSSLAILTAIQESDNPPLLQWADLQVIEDTEMFENMVRIYLSRKVMEAAH